MTTLRINGNKHIILDEINYKGHTIRKVRRMGSYEFYIVDNKGSFGTLAEAKKFANEKAGE